MQRQGAVRTGFPAKLNGSIHGAARQTTRERIVMARMLRDIDHRLTEAEELADRNLAALKEMAAKRR